MSTIKFEINDKVEVCDAVTVFRKQLRTQNIDNLETLIKDVEDIAYDLQCRGKELASLGSQFKTTKLLKAPQCNVKITASYGVRTCNFANALLRKLFRKR